MAELLLTDNICAWLVVAHLLTLRTRREPVDRMLVKNSLLTGLRSCGWEPQKYHDAVDLVERMMTLPKALQDLVDRQQMILEGRPEMAWKYLWEERAEERGLQRGMAAGEQIGLQSGMQIGLQEGRAKGLAEGRAEGWKEGRKEGRLAAKRELLCALLRQRFGQLDEAWRLRIEGASSDELDHWCLAVVTARTIDDVF